MTDEELIKKYELISKVHEYSLEKKTYNEMLCTQCRNNELHKKIDDGIWKCQTCGAKKSL